MFWINFIYCVFDFSSFCYKLSYGYKKGYKHTINFKEAKSLNSWIDLKCSLYSIEKV